MSVINPGSNFKEVSPRPVRLESPRGVMMPLSNGTFLGGDRLLRSVRPSHTSSDWITKTHLEVRCGHACPQWCVKTFVRKTKKKKMATYVLPTTAVSQIYINKYIYIFFFSHFYKLTIIITFCNLFLLYIYIYFNQRKLNFLNVKF